MTAPVWRVLLAGWAATMIILGVLPIVDSTFVLVPVLQALTWPWLAVGLLGFVIALVTRSRVTAGAFVVSVLLIIVTLVTPSVPGCSDADRPELRVMSLNTKLGGADRSQIMSQVRRRRLDVLVLLEANTGQIAALRRAGLGRLLPYTETAQVKSGGGTGTIIWSRYRLTPVAVKPATDVTMGEPAAWLTVGGVRVLLRAVHTYPPLPGWTKRWRAGLHALGQWQRAHRGVPIVLLGDFNATRAHPAFREAARGLDDASGRLTHPTWPNDFGPYPFTTIDHILVRGLGVTTFTTVSVDGTDHRGVTAHLAVCRG